MRHYTERFFSKKLRLRQGSKGTKSMHSFMQLTLTAITPILYTNAHVALCSDKTPKCVCARTHYESAARLQRLGGISVCILHY